MTIENDIDFDGKYAIENTLLFVSANKIKSLDY